MSALRLALLGAVLCASTSAAAAVSTFNDLASFSAAAGSLNLETVNGFTAETSFRTAPVALGGGAFQVQGYGNAQQDRNFVDLQPPQFGVFNVDGTTLLNVLVFGGSGFEFTFAAPIKAFGFDFGAMQNNANRTFIQVAGETLSPPVQTGDVVGFYGFVSTTPFTTIRFANVSGTSDGFGMDNLRWGTGGAGAVPEPASWAMLIAGFGMVGAVSRRRKAVAA
jgi:PEP-CTERM motif